MFISGLNDKIPNVVAQQTSRVRILDATVVPTVDEAVEMYISSGGTITRESTCGFDPLANYDDLIRRREQEFAQNIGSFSDIFTNAINGDGSMMERAILFMYDTTVNLSP